MINTEDFALIERTSKRRIAAVSETFRRYLFDEIDWNNRLIGIKGPKGGGKTTLILQHIKQDIADKDSVLYISLDDLWFTTHDVKDLVEYHYTHGGKYLFVDEVHYFPLWQRLIKNIYDEYPDLYIVFTGSSMLQIDNAQADLSRRMQLYTLNGMSFREYLEFEGLYYMQPVGLKDLLEHHTDIAMEMTTGVKIIPAFEKYCATGYYPFYKETRKNHDQRLMQVVNMILDSDYPTVDGVSISTIRKTRKLLMVLAEAVPQTLNMSQLFRELDTDRNQGLKMLSALQRSGLINLLNDDTKSLKHLSSPEKIYLNNTNLMYALNAQVNKGTVRETFFLNQTACKHHVCYHKQGDFFVDHQYVFEVGGKSKSFDQIKDLPYSFLAIDDTEIGSHNRIPLWMFGLMY